MNSTFYKQYERVRNNLLSPDFPCGINFSLIDNICSNRCRMCVLGHPDGHRNAKPSRMSWEIFSALCSQIPNSKNVTLDCSPMGEPLMFKNIGKWLSYFRKHHPLNPVAISTNARYLTENRAIELFEAGVDIIHCSQWAADRNTYAWLTRTSPEQLDLVQENIKRACLLKRKLGARTQIWTFIFDEPFNDKEKWRFKDYWSNLADHVYMRKLVNNRGYWQDNKSFVQISRQGIKRYPCINFWSTTTIRSDGYVYPCFTAPLDRKFAVGNILENEIVDIWKGEEMERLRTQHLSAKFDTELCSQCEAWANTLPIFARHGEGFKLGYPGEETIKKFGTRTSQLC